jgi:cyclophilin family peptidyl-prolyl cis-trans isomerase
MQRQRGRIRRRASGAALAAALLALAGRPAGADCTAPNPDQRSRVELRTVLGAICFDLLDRPDEAAPTVQNFRNYVVRGDFDGSFFHRLWPGFVLQGGGFRHDGAQAFVQIPTDPPIANDPDFPERSNVRGTVAMAKVAGQPDSATSQFFINLADNAGLDSENGGFTVFARVVPADLPVVDAIAALHTEYGPYAIDDPLAGAFGLLPVLTLLDRDPDGYGCLKVDPDPHPLNGPTGVNNCTSPAEFNASVLLTIAALDPQVPERLVVLEEAVVAAPEPAAPLLLAAGAALLGPAVRRRAQPRFRT